MNKHLIVVVIAVLLICVGLSGCYDYDDSYISDESNIVIIDSQVTIQSVSIDKLCIDNIDVFLKNEGSSSTRIDYIKLSSGDSEIEVILFLETLDAGEEKTISRSTWQYLDKKVGIKQLEATVSIMQYAEKMLAEKNITIPIPFIKVGDTLPEVGDSHNMSMTILSCLEGDIAVTYSNSWDKYTTWSPLEGKKFIVITFEFQNNWIREQSSPYISAGEIATDKGYIYSIWDYSSEHGEYRDATQEEINVYIGTSGGYEKLLQEESTVGCIVFEIPSEEKAIEASISHVPYLIKFEW